MLKETTMTLRRITGLALVLFSALLLEFALAMGNPSLLSLALHPVLILIVYL